MTVILVSLLLAAAPASSSLTDVEKAPSAAHHASIETLQDHMTVSNPADPYDPAVLLDNYTATLLPSAQQLQADLSHSRRLRAVRTKTAMQRRTHVRLGKMTSSTSSKESQISMMLQMHFAMAGAGLFAGRLD